MKIQIENIKIKNRMRKLNAEKVSELANSFVLLGQLEPITVDPNGILLAGWHRLEAARLLGWTSIEATVFEGGDLERELIEIDENLMRNDLTVLEQGEHIQRRNEILEAMGQRREVGRYQNSNGVTVTPLKTTEDIAKEAGLSKNSVQKRAQIARDIVPEVKELIRDTPIADSTTQLLELARLKPEEQINVAKHSVDSDMTVSKAKQEVNRKNRIEIINNQVNKISGVLKYSVILADPPWRYDFSKSDNREIENHYPTMDVEEICNLNISEIANDDCVLFLWATNPKLVEALQVINAWNFTYKTNMVWVKDKIGMGYYARQQHELLLIATKGRLPMSDPKDRVSSVIEAPREEHSKKPEIVYDVIEKLYPEYAKIELFARSKHKNWAVWGNEV